MAYSKLIEYVESFSNCEKSKNKTGIENVVKYCSIIKKVIEERRLIKTQKMKTK